MSERFDNEVLATKIDGLSALIFDKFDASDKKHSQVFEMLNEKIMPAISKMEFIAIEAKEIKIDLKEHLNSHWKWVSWSAGILSTIAAIFLKLLYGGSK